MLLKVCFYSITYEFFVLYLRSKLNIYINYILYEKDFTISKVCYQL